MDRQNPKAGAEWWAVRVPRADKRGQRRHGSSAVLRAGIVGGSRRPAAAALAVLARFSQIRADQSEVGDGCRLSWNRTQARFLAVDLGKVPAVAEAYTDDPLREPTVPFPSVRQFSPAALRRWRR
jgi:hypothetical protein